VPPFGHATQLRVFVDPDLLQYDEVWAAAGTWNDNFGAAPADIVRVAGGVVTDLKKTDESLQLLNLFAPHGRYVRHPDLEWMG
jgi:hypothetical protein